MSKKIYEIVEIKDLKDMLNKTKSLYGNRVAFKVAVSEDEYKEITHAEVRDMVDALGTKLINMGLKGKRIGVIGENRYEWEVAYLATVCGVGTIVPLDKALPESELESLVERSEIEAIFYSEKYEETVTRIKYNEKNKLKHLISMDNSSHKEGIYSETELIEMGKELIANGDRSFLDATIDPEEMQIMLFTSGTTSQSKVVALCHRNLVSNLMDIASILDINETDTFLSFLPVHHVFECTVGFLFSLYKGSKTVFCRGIRHIAEDLNKHQITFIACVPGIYEMMYAAIIKQLEKEGKLEAVKEKVNKYKDLPVSEKTQYFQEVRDVLGGHIRLLVSGAAALDPNIEAKYREMGLNLVQGYGLTETSPVVGVGTTKNYRLGSIGITVPSVEAKLVDVNSEGMGELVVKGPSIMMGYYQNEEATAEVLKDGWFYTGDLAKIDEDGYIFICGRKKSVIVLKNGKNIFPEEMEALVNKIEGVKESFIYGKKMSDDENDIKINVKIVIDRAIVEDSYKVNTDKEIKAAISEKIKEVNAKMPGYKAIRGMIITEEPLLKTTTNKIKRQANLDVIEGNKN